MVERREHAAFGEQLAQILDFGIAGRRGQIGERATFARRLPGKVVGGGDSGKNLHAPAVVADRPTGRSPFAATNCTRRIAPLPVFRLAVATKLKPGAGVPEARPHAEFRPDDAAPLPRTRRASGADGRPLVTGVLGRTEQTSVAASAVTPKLDLTVSLPGLTRQTQPGRAASASAATLDARID